MKTERRQIGDLGEQAAAKFLRKLRYRILARNFTCGHHEIDLIAENREFLIFVEVKTRSYDEKNIERFGAPSAAVDYKKQRYVVVAAKNYLADYKKKRRVRFDIIEVYVSKDNPAEIQSIHHMTDAFRP